MKSLPYLIVMLLPLTACTDCPRPACDNYTYQEEAQLDFERDPNCYKALDADNDQMACEDLPRQYAATAASAKSTVGVKEKECPQTANCGCSNKRKAECPSACCQWIVGRGCKCK